LRESAVADRPSASPAVRRERPASMVHQGSWQAYTGDEAEPLRLSESDASPLAFALNRVSFFRALEPLHAAGKLGAIHFQFAPWITSRGDARQLVEHCARVMEGTTMAVEFRNASWWNERNLDSTLAFEREHGLVNVVVDGPQVGNSVPAVWQVTSPKLAIVRMHGRNHETWNKKGLKAASDRFNYDYTDKELGEIAAQVAELSKAVPVVHAVMNNNYEDQGQSNAKTLTKLLKATPKPAVGSQVVVRSRTPFLRGLGQLKES
jgi:uncharacterized protein YecE (DUF72 family)